MKNTPSVTALTSQPQKLAAIRQSHRNWRESTDVVTRLSRRLGTTLSLEDQLGILAEELGEAIPYDSLSYRHTVGHQEFVYATGKGGPHRCDYRLNLEGSHYGTLTIGRRKRFAEEELEVIELLLGVAICPIRNACQFIAIEQAALTDSLTSIPNKRALDESLKRACCLGDRHGETYSVILCDLDHFKAINDSHGHVIGDHILRETAQQLTNAVRNSDAVYRFGGEEFAVILPHTAEAEAREVADRIRNSLRNISVHCGDTSVSVTASCGVAMRVTSETPDQWIARADQALYQAKDQGRNCTRVFAAINA